MRMNKKLDEKKEAKLERKKRKGNWGEREPIYTKWDLLLDITMILFEYILGGIWYLIRFVFHQIHS
ncbi:hypothetical protein [Heyndrickxia acidicola]|jgi:hypothetical protein|uniref:Uncharacterized protein n=1 Tax=Heyndrickxia acidicola TaxID=209389 RepID=A0ABU6MIN5_9BACI|nr:hypothetical protein [Heyndrickxia acidicola]MED1204535.1 hypothetical protein [Heyndrickxia acidicola]